MLEITPLTAADPPLIAAAFAAIGWDKPQAPHYLDKQTADSRPVLTSRLNGARVGLVTVVWKTSCATIRRSTHPKQAAPIASTARDADAFFIAGDSHRP